MNYYVKLLCLSALFGVLCFCGGETYGVEMKLSELLLNLAFSTADFYPQYIMGITHWFIPLLIFQILYGTYIYRHFCSASVYYFSRNKNRIKWYVRETRKLYVFALCYLIMMVVVGFVVTAVQRTIVFDAVAMGILLYYLLIHSFYLFVSTLWINILSIRFSGVVAFGLVQSVNLLSIAIFTLLGTVVDEVELIQQHTWAFKFNPFAHLVFTLHSSFMKDINEAINVRGIQFDLNESLLFFLVLVLCTLIAGGVIVNRCEFIGNSKEEV